MRKSDLAAGIGAAVGICILILDGKTALIGAQTGVDQCIKTVIPALFPFFLLSNLLVGSLWGRSLPMLLPLARLLGIPKGGESLLVCGFLGGYPVGIQNAASLYSSGQIEKGDALRLTSFIGQPGPAFLFGMVAPMLDRSEDTWVLWGILLYSAFLVSLLTSGSGREISMKKNRSASLSQIMTASLSGMGKVCGWVVLFQVLQAFLKRWVLWYFSEEEVAVIGGLLELSGGCLLLKTIPSYSLRFLIACGILSFGGLCVAMQTVSVLGDLSPAPYLLGKLIQTVFSLMLAFAFVFRLWWIPGLLTGAVFLLRWKKSVAFPRETLYTNGKPVGG